MKPIDEQGRIHLDRLLEMGERNDHAGMTRFVAALKDSQVVDTFLWLASARLEGHQKASSELAESMLAAGDANEQRQVLRTALAFATTDGLAALQLNDTLSELLSEIVATANGVGDLEHRAFDALMDGKVDHSPEVDREAADERIASLRNAMTVISSIAESVASGGKCQTGSTIPIEDIQEGVVSANLQVISESMALATMDHMARFFGRKPHPSLHVMFQIGWMSATTAIVEGEENARAWLEGYLKETFNEQG